MKFVLVFALALAVLICYATAVRPEHCYDPHPTGIGKCRMLLYGFWFNPASNECEKWSQGGCETVGGHSYDTFEACVADCIDSE